MVDNVIKGKSILNENLYPIATLELFYDQPTESKLIAFAPSDHVAN